MPLGTDDLEDWDTSASERTSSLLASIIPVLNLSITDEQPFLVL